MYLWQNLCAFFERNVLKIGVVFDLEQKKILEWAARQSPPETVHIFCHIQTQPKLRIAK
jgi:hypothetical protein